MSSDDRTRFLLEHTYVTIPSISMSTTTTTRGEETRSVDQQSGGGGGGMKSKEWFYLDMPGRGV